MRLIKLAIFIATIAVAFSSVASATPAVNSAVLTTRIWNDCPNSILMTDNNYPTWIFIDDAVLAEDCYGYANLHTWRFSTDGLIPVDFANGDAFRFGADFTLSGTGEGEGGLQIAPWWSLCCDGKFMIRSKDSWVGDPNKGEIAVFGGRLPFFSFTGTFGVEYTKGTTIHVEMIYLPNGLTALSPATVEYKLIVEGTPYTSGPLPFDQGNPAEGHGEWGMLTPAQVGGFFQPYLGGGDARQLRATWGHIEFEDLSVPPVATEPTTWGRIKAVYR
jgi:hypothetical protein